MHNNVEYLLFYIILLNIIALAGYDLLYTVTDQNIVFFPVPLSRFHFDHWETS